MRWVKRFLLGLCTMLALAAGFEHWRSYRISSVGHWYGENSWVGVYCARGKIVIGIGRERIASVIKHDYYERPLKLNRSEVEFNETYHGGQRMGIGYYQSNDPTVGYVLMPIWLIWGLGSAPMLVAMLRIRRRKLRSSGNLCINCGYDLHGCTEKCPECGQNVGKGKQFLAYSN